MTFQLVTRKDWGAVPLYPGGYNIGQVNKVFIHHTATPLDMPLFEIQQQHIHSNGWADIGYSFLARQYGTELYEGRGWGKTGAHTVGFNSTSYALSFIGNFQDVDEVTDAMISLAAEWIIWGQDIGYIAPEFSVYGHRDANATACPGVDLYNRIAEIPQLVEDYRNNKLPDNPLPPTGDDEVARLSPKVVRSGILDFVHAPVNSLLHVCAADDSANGAFIDVFAGNGQQTWLSSRIGMGTVSYPINVAGRVSIVTNGANILAELEIR